MTRRPAHRRAELHGRVVECETLDVLLDKAQMAQSGALVLRGGTGVGKSALLDYTLRRAAAFRVETATGSSSETSYPFAGLHQLCAPMLDQLEALPAPQRNALSTAFGMGGGTTPDGFLVGLAVLGLFAEVASERPMLCIVDDAQWLDDKSLDVLSFVARRFQSQPIAFVFAVREPSPVLQALPALAVENLLRREARDLLSSVIAGPLDGRIRDQIVAETGGNPGALLALSQAVDLDRLAGGFGFVTALPAADNAVEDMRRRLELLPEETRRLLLVAAAEPGGDSAVLWRASASLGIDVGEAAAAETERLLEFGQRVQFRDVFARAVVYAAAPIRERERVHAALADATDPEVDPDWHNWHRARATHTPDEALARELAQAGARAQQHGGLPARAAFLELAAALAADPARRAERQLAAAEANRLAGLKEPATRLLGRVRAAPTDALTAALAERLELQLEAAPGPGRETTILLAELARRLDSLDRSAARDTFADALGAALLDGRVVDGQGAIAVAQAVRGRASRTADSPTDSLIAGLGEVIVEGYNAAVATLIKALGRLGGIALDAEESGRALPLACQAARLTWDDEAWGFFSDRQLEWARAAGARTRLSSALTERIALLVRMGDLANAAALVDELETACACGQDELTPSGALELAAWRGRESDAGALISFALDEVDDTGETRRLPAIHAARAVLCNGLARYEEALNAASEASAQTPELRLPTLALSELAEAASRCGRLELAASALEQLSQSAAATRTDWALGTEARARALLSADEETEGLYRQALTHFGRTRLRAELARTHLVYGEWLRREHRRIDARNQLRMAEAMFMDMGFVAFGRRAERELVATGETVRKRSDETRGQLTPQEREIARMACEGLSNPEIGSQLFLSPRTVEWHLHKIFVKLAVGSRKDLRSAMATADRRSAGRRRLGWSEVANLEQVDPSVRRTAGLREPAVQAIA